MPSFDSPLWSDLLRLGFLLLLPVAVRVLTSARRRRGDDRNDTAADGGR